MAEKLWRDCPKEERKRVNQINRDYRRIKADYEEGLISREDFDIFLTSALKKLELLEWLYDDKTVEFLDYKRNYALYNQFRKKIRGK